MVKEPRWNAITNPEGYANRMTEKERIDFIREYGTEVMLDGLNSIFYNRKYTPIKPEMWRRMGKGKRMVQTIIEKRLGIHIKEN